MNPIHGSHALLLARELLPQVHYQIQRLEFFEKRFRVPTDHEGDPPPELYLQVGENL